MIMFMYGIQWVHVIISASIAYLIMKVGGPKSRIITATVALLYLACMHIYRQVTDYLGWTIDVTFTLMVVTQKLHGLAFNYYGKLLCPSSPLSFLPSMSEVAVLAVVRWQLREGYR